jgi:nicotinamide mononucleotide adenylyltransferase
MKGMLDLSIQNIDKIITTDEKASLFLDQEITITEKVDGTKLTVFRKDTPFDKRNLFDNFIFAYKRNILYAEEYPIFDRNLAMTEGIGDSQYGFVFDKFLEAGTELMKLPRGTEFFIEFVMKKPTLSREYEQLHALILIGYAKSIAIEKPGILTTFPEAMETELVEEYANIMKIFSPRVIFKGITEGKHATQKLRYLHALKTNLLDTESQFGGKMEGVVIATEDSLYKFVQADQYDKDYRYSIKMKYQMEKEKEDAYFLDLKSIASKFLETLDYTYPFRSNLSVIAVEAYYHATEIPTHEKKTEFQIREDYYHVLKYLFIKKIPENNNFMFIGRMQPPTFMHLKMIEEALKTHSVGVIAIVKGKKSEKEMNPFTFETQKKIIEKVFPGIEILQVSTGNLITAMNSSSENINTFICGEDRAESYRTQLKNNPEITVHEFYRNSEGISGTKVRNALKQDNRLMFQENMHPLTWNFFDELKDEISIYSQK